MQKSQIFRTSPQQLTYLHQKKSANMAEKVQPDFTAAENKPFSAICVLKAIIRHC
jgi:hypothetical protein